MLAETLPATIGSNKDVKYLDLEILASLTYTFVRDEELLYKKLSNQLIVLEKSIDYNADQVSLIREKARKMFQLIDEKKELLIRCDWLVKMKEIEGQLSLLDSLHAIQATQRQLGQIQTCPLKNELQQKLEKLEKKFQLNEKQLSPQEALVENVFVTGNETFINLGTAGRNRVIEEVLACDGKVETAIAKAEELEVKVQSIKNIKSIDELRQTLQGLPLQYFSAIPSEYEVEVLQLLIENPNWNGLFQLDLQIKQFTSQVDCKYNSKQEDVQEGVYQTIELNEKLIEQLGVKQL